MWSDTIIDHWLAHMVHGYTWSLHINYIYSPTLGHSYFEHGGLLKLEKNLIKKIKFTFFIAGSFNGSLSSLAAHQLGSIVIKEALQRANVKGEEVSEVIMGQILNAGWITFIRHCHLINNSSVYQW